MNKHSSLLQTLVNYECKKLYNIVLQVLDKGNKEMDHLTKELMDAKLGSNSGGTSFKLAPCHSANLPFSRLPFCHMIFCFINLLIF
jgi:hypothetical protein